MTRLFTTTRAGRKVAETAIREIVTTFGVSSIAVRAAIRESIACNATALAHFICYSLKLGIACWMRIRSIIHSHDEKLQLWELDSL